MTQHQGIIGGTLKSSSQFIGYTGDERSHKSAERIQSGLIYLGYKPNNPVPPAHTNLSGSGKLSAGEEHIGYWGTGTLCNLVPDHN